MSQIGVAGDENLLQLASDSFTVNGDTALNGNLTIGGTKATIGNTAHPDTIDLLSDLLTVRHRLNIISATGRASHFYFNDDATFIRGGIDDVSEVYINDLGDNTIIGNADAGNYVQILGEFTHTSANMTDVGVNINNLIIDGNFNSTPLNLTGTGGTISNLVVNTALVCDAASGCNVGSTALEIANVYVGTGRVYFGAGQASSIYDDGSKLIIAR